MVFHRRSKPGSRVALLPGTFNPPTIAHQALLNAALALVDEAIVVLPRKLPHKEFDGASLEERLRMLEQLSTLRPYSIAVADQGLFVDLSEEFRRDSGGPVEELFIVTGRDAAERILQWPYEDPSTIERMFQRFQLLVAARLGEFEAPIEYRHRIRGLELDPAMDKISSTHVRELIRSGGSWRGLVPQGVGPIAEQVYLRVTR